MSAVPGAPEELPMIPFVDLCHKGGVPLYLERS